MKQENLTVMSEGQWSLAVDSFTAVGLLVLSGLIPDEARDRREKQLFKSKGFYYF
jgi:hypothetical protein